MKTLRFKSNIAGITATWRIGKNRSGKFKVVSLGRPKIGRDPIPLAFIPFEMSNAVINSPEFDTEIEAERFIRRL